jgi:hypothetical protein
MALDCATRSMVRVILLMLRTLMIRFLIWRVFAMA